MSSEQTNLNFSIKSIDDIIRCLTLASLLELAGWPKPGNIHRTKDFESTRFEHFLAGIVAIQPDFREFCERIYHLPFVDDGDFSLIELGEFFTRAVKSMLKWQSGGNVLLGHILILAPLAAAASTGRRWGSGCPRAGTSRRRAGRRAHVSWVLNPRRASGRNLHGRP